jgi:hypothetical protein
MTIGAGIFCVVCGARPEFDLMRLDREGRPAESPASGEWFCLQHFERVGGCYRISAEWIATNEEPSRSEAMS